jgi:predicted ABC-type ATPase
MTSDTSKKIIIIAGPNGAGKTTFAKNFLPQEAHTFRFINADLIAAGLAPFNPESVSFKAARLMLNELGESTKAGENFAFETTLSGTHYLQRIQEWKDLGYTIKLWFIALSSCMNSAISRVAERVAQGGHNIPEEVIRRRYKAGLENLPKYQKAVNSWVLLDGDSIGIRKNCSRIKNDYSNSRYPKFTRSRHIRVLLRYPTRQTGGN